MSGEDGSWLAATEYNDKYECLGFAVGCVGKHGIEPNTYYLAKNGKLIKA